MQFHRYMLPFLLAGALVVPAQSGEATDYATVLLVGDLVCSDVELPVEFLGVTIVKAAEEMGKSEEAARWVLAVEANILAEEFDDATKSERDGFCRSVSGIVGQWNSLKAEQGVR